MAREEQQPMSDARLEELKAKNQVKTTIVGGHYWRNQVTANDVDELLAEVERLRAREAALMEVVQAVAEAGIDVSERPDASYLCFDGMERADELQAEARTLLADADKREKGNDDGKY